MFGFGKRKERTWKKSLSGETIVTFKFASPTARRDTVPIMSSASTPDIDNTGMPMRVTMSMTLVIVKKEVSVVWAEEIVPSQDEYGQTVSNSRRDLVKCKIQHAPRYHLLDPIRRFRAVGFVVAEHLVPERFAFRVKHHGAVRYAYDR